MATDIFRFGKWALLGVAGLLAGCGDGPASSVSYKHSDQVWEFFVFAVKDGPMLVEIDGNPFAGPKEALDEVVTAAMRATFTEPFVSFTTDRAAAVQPDYRVLWTLNPAAGYDINAVCTAHPAVDPAPRDRLEMRVAFCQGGRLLAAVHGWMPAREAGPDNARWRSLISQMSRQLVSKEGT